jgi:glycosyltransferase involved in cell wall biosynthesis
MRKLRHRLRSKPRGLSQPAEILLPANATHATLILMKTPLISVIVPTYNHAELLGDCLNSILNQSFGDFELLVSDNCSTDGTAEVLAAIKDSRLRTFRQDSNIGAHANGKFLLAQAAAPFIKTFCSDDVMAPGLLARQYSVLEDQHQVGVVSCDALIVSADTPAEVWRVRHGYWTGVQPLHDCLKQASNELGNPSSFMFRREALAPLGFDPGYAFLSDLVLASRILAAGWHYYGLDYVGFRYLRHAGADTNRVQHALISDWIKLMQESRYLPREGILALADRCKRPQDEVLLAELVPQFKEGLNLRVAGDLLDRFRFPESRARVERFLRDGRRLGYFRHRLRRSLARSAAKILNMG